MAGIDCRGAFCFIWPIRRKLAQEVAWRTMEKVVATLVLRVIGRAAKRSGRD
jgi:hypothetical protein